MARRAPEEVYATLREVGFSVEDAILMTAIAGAESGWDPSALGDVNLANDTWGPSYGLFQIRTLKSQTGTGGVRDIARLSSGDLEQARAAYVISGGGTDYTPWSVYTTGAYQAYLEAARAAAQRAGDPAGPAGPFPTLGPDWLPWNWPSVAGNWTVGGVEDVADEVLTGGRHIALEAAFVVAGLALAAVGVWMLGRPQRQLWHRAQRGVLRAVGLG